MTSATPTLQDFIAFVAPFYKQEDPLHDLPHIARVLDKVDEIRGNQPLDLAALAFAAYVHGIRKPDLARVEDWLLQNLKEETARKILGIAHESHSKSTPHSPEGIILHDAHLLEGGENFLAIKCLLTSAYRGQRAEEAIAFTEENILGQFRCAHEGRQAEYEQRENKARQLFSELKKSLKP